MNLKSEPATEITENVEANKKYICDHLDLPDYSIIEEFPLYVQIETTARCNSKCLMCPRSKEIPRRRSWEMSQSLRERLIEELAQHSDHIRRVIPQGYGEPLMDDNLQDFIFQMKKIGIKEVYISSNGSLMDIKKARALLESGLDQIDFSVDAATSSTYEFIRKGLDYKTVLNNINSFIRIRDEYGFKTRVRFRYILQEGVNESELEDFYSYWRPRLSMEDAISVKKIHTFGGNVSMPQVKEYHELKRKLMRLPCKGIFGTFTVLSDGTAPICGVDVNQAHIAGNISENAIREIWKGDLYRQFRRRHLEKGRVAYHHCPDCNSWAPELKLLET